MERERLRRIREGLRNWWGSPVDRAPALEPVYQRLFERELAAHGLKDEFHPVGSAANYSLLYLILRIATELRPRSVLEVGAGQSTLLCHQLAQAGFLGRVVTLESDARWAETVRARVAHEVIHSELERRAVDGREALTYDWGQVEPRGPFDLVIVDGPMGERHYSRFGAAAVVPWLAGDFVVVFDDAERKGEWDTIRHVRDRLRARGPVATSATAGVKAQYVMAGGAYVRAVYL